MMNEVGDRKKPSKGRTIKSRPALKMACIEKMVEKGGSPTDERIATAIKIETKTYINAISGGTRPRNSTIENFRRFLEIDWAKVEALFDENESASTELMRESKYDELLADKSNDDSVIPRKKTWLKLGIFQITAIIVSGLFLTGLSIGYFTSTPDAAPSESKIFPDAGTCLIDFTQPLPGFKYCGSIGTIGIEGPNMEQWNSLVTAIDVPLHWTVYARYEKWEPPKYEHFQDYGYVLLAPGLNRFDVMSFQLYKDFELKEFVKVTEPHEMNDRIQYLIVTSAASDTNLIVHKHKELDHPEKLSASVVENESN